MPYCSNIEQLTRGVYTMGGMVRDSLWRKLGGGNLWWWWWCFCSCL